MTFSSLDYFLYQKLTDSPDRYYSPAKLRGATLEYEPAFAFKRLGNVPKIRMYEKTSPRSD